MPSDAGQSERDCPGGDDPGEVPGDDQGADAGRLGQRHFQAGSLHRDGFAENLVGRAGPVFQYVRYQPDFAALAASPTRIVIAVGEESAGIFTGRTSVATADLLGQKPTVFPSHHGGFVGGESGYAGQPEAFARKLREVLDEND